MMIILIVSSVIFRIVCSIKNFYILENFKFQNLLRSHL
ncbi:unnamed protein product [Tenebrio molitor]|nr:unnamed protein product [Tenebrio molitor]